MNINANIEKFNPFVSLKGMNKKIFDKFIVDLKKINDRPVNIPVKFPIYFIVLFLKFLENKTIPEEIMNPRGLLTNEREKVELTSSDVVQQNVDATTKSVQEAKEASRKRAYEMKKIEEEKKRTFAESPAGFLKLSYENGKIATFVNIIKTLNNIITGDNESNAIEKGLENINTLKTLIENGGLNDMLLKK